MKYILVICLLFAAFSLSAQYQRTLMSGPVQQGFDFGAGLKFSQIGNQEANFLGGYANWILDHQLYFGLGAYGLVSDYDLPFHASDNLVMDLAYGGFLLNVDVNPLNLVHVGIGTMVGGGTMSLRDRYDDYYYDDYYDNSLLSESFFLLEPAVTATINVTDNFHMAVDGSYRFTNGLNNDFLQDSEMRRFALGIHLQVGWF
jgi:hypothetical protein